MKKLLAIERTKAAIIAIVMIVFGVLFVALPQTSYNIISKVLAGLLIGIGLLLLILYFVNFKKLSSSINFVGGVLLMGLGILMMFVPGLYIVAIGMVLVFTGTQYMGLSLDRKRSCDPGWWKDLVYGIIEFVIGLILIILNYTSVAQRAVMLYMGISLIIDGVFILIAMITFDKKKKVKIIEEKPIEIEIDQ